MLRCAGCEGSGRPSERLQLGDIEDFSQIRFMESFESKHSDHSFTAQLAAKLGVTQSPLRLDSQAKYGALSSHVLLLRTNAVLSESAFLNVRSDA